MPILNNTVVPVLVCVVHRYVTSILFVPCSEENIDKPQRRHLFLFTVLGFQKMLLVGNVLMKAYHWYDKSSTQVGLWIKMTHFLSMMKSEIILSFWFRANSRSSLFADLLANSRTLAVCQ